MQPVQIRMARAALGLSVDDMAKQADVPSQAVVDIEAGAEGKPAVLQRLSLFLSVHGIELIDGDGVRAKPPQTNDFVTVDHLTTDNDGGEG